MIPEKQYITKYKTIARVATTFSQIFGEVVGFKDGRIEVVFTDEVRVGFSEGEVIKHPFGKGAIMYAPPGTKIFTVEEEVEV